nr:hypothetical protein [uncultured Sphaerochaeta sp.]
MLIKIGIKQPYIEQMTNPDFSFFKKNGNQILIWGYVLLFERDSFDTELFKEVLDIDFDLLIPKMTGNFLAVEIANNKIIHLSSDFYGHARVYLLFESTKILVTDDLSKINFSEYEDYDDFQIQLFLEKGYTWEGGTFFQNLKIITPSVKYRFITVEGKTRVEKSYLPFPRIINRGERIHDIMADTLLGLAKNNENSLALMFSSGIDSTYIREVAYQKGINIESLTCNIKDPKLWVVQEDVALAKKLSLGKRRVSIIDLDNVYRLMDDTFKETVRMLPFEFHISVFQLFLSKYAKQQKIKILITGQNADSIYNYGNTSVIKFSESFKCLMHLQLHGMGLTILFDRLLQTGEILKSIQRGKPNALVSIMWKRLFPNYVLNVQNLLLHFLFPEVMSLIDDPIKSQDTMLLRESYKKIEDLLQLYEKGETLRMILIRSKLIGHCQGRDVRCITEWSKNVGVDNIQIFTSAPLISFFGLNNLDIRDVVRPKRLLHQYINKFLKYDKIKKHLTYDNDVDMINDEITYFRSIYESLDKCGEMSQLKNKAKEFLRDRDVDNSIVGMSSTEEQAKNMDFRLAWLQMTIQNLDRRNDCVERELK